jgi:hypothetical protein
MKNESNDLATPNGRPNMEEGKMKETANPLFRKILRASHLFAIFYGVDMGIRASQLPQNQYFSGCDQKNDEGHIPNGSASVVVHSKQLAFPVTVPDEPHAPIAAWSAMRRLL